jgi:hypothetical protein
MYFWLDSTVREDGVVAVSQQWLIAECFQNDRSVTCSRTRDGRCFGGNASRGTSVNGIVFEECDVDRGGGSMSKRFSAASRGKCQFCLRSL